jgi:hypothetical protein
MQSLGQKPIQPDEQKGGEQQEVIEFGPPCFKSRAGTAAKKNFNKGDRQ